MSEKKRPADHNRQKKIAVINDLTGFGRCSLAVSIPIISHLGIQCCFVPTAILSNQTDFPSYFFDDYTDHFEEYTGEWEKLGLTFNGIQTGFLCSAEQVELALKFFDRFRTKDTVIAVDPVMGDHGHLYPSYTSDMCDRMKALVARADMIMPNLTEACILTDTPYHSGRWTKKELFAVMEALAAMGPRKIAITGIPQGEFIANLAWTDGGEPVFNRQIRIGDVRSGTGDVFSSVLIADAVGGVDFGASVRRASSFVRACIEKSLEMGIPETDGVAFEEVLGRLAPCRRVQAGRASRE